MPDPKAPEMPEGWRVFPDGGTENQHGDSFEWVNDGVTVGVRRAATHYFTELPIDVIRALLSAHGLTIVSEAERKVLEACEAIDDLDNPTHSEQERLLVAESQRRSP